ncbi:DUF4855 domain-containing protein [Paenibacillus lautus]|uniref:DUF4855 domain-containing protein n=1 Tax=Paenibacillus lautus TaxID=1401 RepID=UPI000FDC0F4B|nr:DUF4855 domain-containing protein [Paenibacillus lautus]
MKINAKRSICLILVSVMTAFLAIPAASAAYLPKNDPRSNYSSNIALIYTGYYNPANYDGENIGDYDKDKFLPYVGYLDEQGRAQDDFFDTFLMLSLQSPHGGSLHRWYDWVPNSVPGRLVDWQYAMERPFVKNLQLDALDQAVKQVGSDLENRDKQVNVYLTIPFPDPQSRDFGDFNGDGVSDDLISLEARNELVQWYIDTMVERFKSKGYKHLKLAGFYWLQEDLDTTVQGEAENVKATSDYLNSKGMRLGWIPWSGAGEKGNGNKHGYDFTLVQPNHYFQAETTIKRIEETAALSRNNGQGVEIEFDQRAIENPYYRQVFYNYLIGGVKYGYMADSLLAYYQDVYAIYDFYHHRSPIGRQLYDDIYRFAKGTFVPPIGDIEARVIDRDGNPIPDAQVTNGDGFSAWTDSNGRFATNDQFAIQYTFTVAKEGYQSRTVRFDAVQSATIRKDIVLAPSGGPIAEQQVIADFEGEFNVGGNSVVNRSFNTEAEFVRSGEQSLKAVFPNGWGPVRAFIDSGSEALAGSDRQFINYTNTDWSAYDSIGMDVYNATNTEQLLELEFMYDQYSWASSRVKQAKLAPGQWNRVEIPFAELRDAGVNLQNIIRLSLKMNEFPTEGATLFFDNINLLKYESLDKPTDTYIALPSSVPTMDIGARWTPSVMDRASLDEQGKHTVVADASFESSNPAVLEVTPDGVLKALAPGKATLRAFANGIEAESKVIEVSGQTFHELKGGRSKLTPGESATISLRSFFDNGYLIPRENASYSWSVKGDAVLLNDKLQQDGTAVENEKLLVGVKNGSARISVTVTYNGKSETIERLVIVTPKGLVAPQN